VRLRRLLLALGLLATAPLGAARADLLDVLNSGDATVSILDPATRQKVRRIPVLREPHHLLLSPDGGTPFATSRCESRLAEIDPVTLAVRRLWNIPGGPDCLAFDPEGRVWMTLRWAGRVAVLDPREAEPQVQTVRVGRSPHGIFLKPRREGVRGDFAQYLPGAVSGSRPLPAPLAPRAAPALGLPGPVTPAALRPAP